MAASLPDELLARILSPVDSIRSLVQARAVCKSWQAAVESKQVRDLRDTTTADPLIALTGGGIHGRGYSDHVLTNKLSFKFGRDGAWFAGPPMPEPRIEHGVVQVGRKIYVVGGSSEQSGQVKRTLVYDVWTATWTDAPKECLLFSVFLEQCLKLQPDQLSRHTLYGNITECCVK